MTFETDSKGMIGSTPSMRSSAKCFQDRPAASRITDATILW
jgi:hypothetical protein